jgi:hypothetical protein
MGLFRKLLEWLSPKPKRAARKWDPHTNPIDVQKIAKDLRLKEEGARLGAAGVPMDTETSLCGPETHALLAIEQARTDYIEWAQLRLKSLNGELTRLDVAPELTAAAESADEFERRADADITANASAIKQLEEEATSRQQEFERFRKEHNRLNLPHYLKGLPKILAWVFAVALITVEALLNASFFAKGLAGGLIDGFAEAAIAASLNVLVCLAAGSTVLRFVHHVKIGPRLFGIVMAALASCFILILALMVAHYREALVMGLENAQSVAIQTFLATPFTLREVSSWYLFLIGVVFGALAVVDGYKIDDPYPGYGKLHLRTVAAVEAYTDAIGQLHEHLSELKETMLAKVDYALSHSATSVVSFKSVISDKERCKDDLSNMIKDSPAMLGALLAEFRTENVVTRRPHGYITPPGFNTTPFLQELKVPNFDTTTDKESLAKQEALLAEFLTKAPDVRARIQTGYNANFNSVHTLASHFDGIGITSKASRAVVTVATAEAAAVGVQ